MAKPSKATKEAEHTISSGNKTYHKKEVADVTKIVKQNKNLLLEEKKTTSEKKEHEKREADRSTGLKERGSSWTRWQREMMPFLTQSWW